MPVVVYSALRLVLLAACWVLLTWAGLHPLLALGAAAFIAWGLSYAALGGPRDAAARYLAEAAARRAAHAGHPVLSARAREDADVEDAAVDAALAVPDEAVPDEAVPDEAVPDPDRARQAGRDGAPHAGPDAAQSASASPSSTP